MNEELYFKDAFTEVDGNINLDINNLNANCITSKNNKFSLDSEGNLLVNSITTSLNNNFNIDQIYPVGSIYLSLVNTNPGVLFGGVWESIAEGRTLVGVDTSQEEFNTVKKTGGSKYLQKHYHDIRYLQPDGAGVTISYTGTGEGCLNISNFEWSKNIINELNSASNLRTSNVGLGDSGNLQPYLTCYIWTRIS